MTPDLSRYDIILVNTSGGKDSQTMLRLLVGLATDQGVLHRMTAVHADLGRLEWPGTKELAIAQAAHYGLPTVVTAKRGGDLLDAVEARGMWPDQARRYCTSDFKRGPVLRVMTSLVRTFRETHRRQVRILNCLGMRAQESSRRAKMPPFVHNERASNGRRYVDDWLPIHGWKLEEVWADIHASRIPYHPVYDEGMPRLSCSFCVLASKSALVRAAQLRPELAAEYAGVEARVGHSFQKALSMADIIAAASITDTPQPITDWAA